MASATAMAMAMAMATEMATAMDGTSAMAWKTQWQCSISDGDGWHHGNVMATTMMDGATETATAMAGAMVMGR